MTDTDYTTSTSFAEQVRDAAAQYVEADSFETILVCIGMDDVKAADASGVQDAAAELVDVIELADTEAEILAAAGAVRDLMDAGVPVLDGIIVRLAKYACATGAA